MATTTVRNDGRTCTKCYHFKPWSEFNLNAAGIHGHSSRCKSCSRQVTRKDYNRDYYRRKTYGLKQSDIENKLKNQGGLCPGCGVELIDDGPRRSNSACVDHDHMTGKNRDILCLNCNMLLGHAKDDPTILRRLADYLERHK